MFKPIPFKKVFVVHNTLQKSNNVRNCFRHLRCAHISTSGVKCKGTGKLVDGQYRPGKVPDTHEPYDHYEEDQIFLDKLKAAVCNPGQIDFKEIYDGFRGE